MSEKYGIPMKDLKGYMTPEQVKTLLDNVERLRDKLILRILWVTGCRISELIGDKCYGTPKHFHGLLYENIRWNEGMLILDTLKRKEYPPPQRMVKVDTKTLEMLKTYCTKKNIKSGRIFNITRQRMWQIIREIGEKCKILHVGSKTIHPHNLRHSSCVAYVRKNNTMVGLKKLQQKLGHANINTTAHYLQFSADEQVEVEEVFGEW